MGGAGTYHREKDYAGWNGTHSRGQDLSLGPRLIITAETYLGIL